MYICHFMPPSLCYELNNIMCTCNTNTSSLYFTLPDVVDSLWNDTNVSIQSGHVKIFGCKESFMVSWKQFKLSLCIHAFPKSALQMLRASAGIWFVLHLMFFCAYHSMLTQCETKSTIQQKIVEKSCFWQHTVQSESSLTTYLVPIVLLYTVKTSETFEQGCRDGSTKEQESKVQVLLHVT